MKGKGSILSPRFVAVFWILFVFGFSLLMYLLAKDKSIALLQTSGTVANKQRDLIYFTLLLSIVVLVPVFGLTIFMATKYRASNHSTEYTPSKDGSKKLEFIWWGIPIVLIGIISVVIWNTSHSLDPYRPLSSQKPLEIQVVALDWKWLFIYPEENIATVNYIEIPINTPVRFRITSDAPMNSFWLPELGGQIYAMAGMETNLNLEANKIGTYSGRSANISGEGFSSMTFTVTARSKEKYDDWVKLVQNAPKELTNSEYSLLQKPTKGYPIAYYRDVQDNLYNTIIGSYMSHNQMMNDKDSHMEGH